MTIDCDVWLVLGLQMFDIPFITLVSFCFWSRSLLVGLFQNVCGV